MALSHTLTEVLTTALDARAEEIWTTLPGKVVSYAGGLADVQPCVRRPIRDTEGALVSEEIPIVPGVRVVFFQAGPFSFTFPITPGVTGLLLIPTYSIDQWLENGEIASPRDLRLHHPGSAAFLAGLSINSAKPSTVDDPDVVLEAPMMRLGVNATSFVALATLVDAELNAIAASIAAGFDATTGPPLHSSPTTPYSPGSVAATKVKAE